ncbi:VlmB-like protein [Streptomyces spectabilis]|uniref:VlmB-like protein n=1 Tax=Streptomyces spectabilis TaxID=68270 RepID=A0A516R1Y4_STRST|nr:VlmB-like protein [Streptomyces spectabilis]QDQ09661.1 VlmB-like protein [Streptomyces spectabilis]
MTPPTPSTAPPGGIPAEADWDRAPSLLDGAETLELTPAVCNLRYWLNAVPQGTLRGRALGHDSDVRPLDVVTRPGPLNSALTQELAYRSVAEDKATRAIGYMTALAPDTDTMEFYATQLIDEARHAMVFRSHLLELGVPHDELSATVERLSATDREHILVPLENLGLRVLRDERDFVGGVLVLTVLVEGVLAPAAELSERKWRVFDPAAADIERGAGIDEIRHLTVGSAVVRDHLLRHPHDKERLLGLIQEGYALWEKLPTTEQLMRREELFQQGVEQHRDLLGDYEIWPGRRLADTTAEERLETGHAWAARMQRTRLVHMGLEEAT